MTPTRLLTLLAGLALAATSVAQNSTPNILFIFTDDHCQQAISAYGCEFFDTPNMDRIANEGMKFQNNMVTNAICGPSRAVILTGKYSHVNGFMVNGQSFDGTQQTFPKLLQKQGYETCVVGKWHLGTDPTGFTHYDVLMGQGPYYNPPMLTPGPDGKSVRTPHTGYTTDIITDKALAWLKQGRDQNKPFMLMYQHKAPHRNWQPAPEYLSYLDDVEIPEPETLWDDYSNRTSAASNQAMTISQHLNDSDLKLVAPRNLTPEQLEAWNAAYEPKNKAFREAKLEGRDLVKWKYQRYVKDYLRCVRSVDDGIGEVLDYLDEAGLAENTVVMYSSDQGWYLGEHGWFDKRWMYQESLLSPLMVRWPGVVKPGSVNTDMVSNLDFAETFLEIAGASIPDDMQGRSLVPILKGTTPDDWRSTFYYHYYEFPGAHDVARHYGVTNGKHKLIYFYENDEWELFDLEKDPNELMSEYNNPEYAPIVAGLKEEMTALRNEYSVPEEDPESSRRKKGKKK